MSQAPHAAATDHGNTYWQNDDTSQAAVRRHDVVVSSTHARAPTYPLSERSNAAAWGPAEEEYAYPPSQVPPGSYSHPPQVTTSTVGSSSGTLNNTSLQVAPRIQQNQASRGGKPTFEPTSVQYSQRAGAAPVISQSVYSDTVGASRRRSGDLPREFAPLPTQNGAYGAAQVAYEPPVGSESSGFSHGKSGFPYQSFQYLTPAQSAQKSSASAQSQVWAPETQRAPQRKESGFFSGGGVAQELPIVNSHSLTTGPKSSAAPLGKPSGGATLSRSVPSQAPKSKEDLGAVGTHLGVAGSSQLPQSQQLAYQAPTIVQAAAAAGAFSGGPATVGVGTRAFVSQAGGVHSEGVYSGQGQTAVPDNTYPLSKPAPSSYDPAGVTRGQEDHNNLRGQAERAHRDVQSTRGPPQRTDPRLMPQSSSQMYASHSYHPHSRGIQGGTGGTQTQPVGAAYQTDRSTSSAAGSSSTSRGFSEVAAQPLGPGQSRSGGGYGGGGNDDGRDGKRPSKQHGLSNTLVEDTTASSQPREGKVPQIATLTRVQNSRIESSVIPRPTPSTDPVPRRGGKRYETDKYTVPPPPLGVYTVLDRGSVSCRFMRITLNQMPQSASLLSTSCVPLVSVITPFSPLGEYEEPVPMVNLTRGSPAVPANAPSEGPPRCTRCRVYVNPFMVFTGEKLCHCNFCGHVFENPVHYSYALSQFNALRFGEDFEESRGESSPSKDPAQYRFGFPPPSRDPRAPTREYGGGVRSSSEDRLLYHRPELLQGCIDFVPPDDVLHSSSTPVAAQSFTTTGAMAGPGVGASFTPTAAMLGASKAVRAFVPPDPLPAEEDYLVNLGAKIHDAPAVCFVIETTYAAQSVGLVESAIRAIQSNLRNFPSVKSKVSIVAFDKTVKFLSLHPRSFADGRASPRVFVVSDVDDPYLPAPHRELLINVSQNVALLSELCELLVPLLCFSKHSHTTHGLICEAGVNSAAGAAMKVCAELLGDQGGGSVISFVASAPNIGFGAYGIGDVVTVGGNSATKSKTVPLEVDKETIQPFKTLASRCNQLGVAFDFVVCPLPHSHVGLRTLSYPCRMTGGHLRYYPGYSVQRDYEQLREDVCRMLSKPQAFQCILRLRCSRGLSVKNIYAPWTTGAEADASVCHMSHDKSAFFIARLDADMSIAVELENEGSLPEQKNAYLQCVCLHLTTEGWRLLRVMTLAVPVTSSLTTVFKYAENETVLTYLVRYAADMICSGPQTGMLSRMSRSSASSGTQDRKWKEKLQTMLVNMLHSYRVNCAGATSVGQLILPDSMKTLPVFMSGMFKNAAFREASDVFTDERDFSMTQLLAAPPQQLCLKVYPLLYPLHRSYVSFKGEKLGRIGLDTGVTGNVYLPACIACSGERVTTDGLFMIDDGDKYQLYVGADVDSEVCQEVFGVERVTTENVDGLQVDAERGGLGANILKVVDQLRRDKENFHWWQPLTIIPPKSFAESRFIWKLVEDRLGAELGYIDFLCQLHRQVKVKIDNGV